MKIFFTILLLQVVKSQSINMEIHNNLFLFIKDEVIANAIQSLKNKPFTIDDGRILSESDDTKYYLNLGGGEYYAYYYTFQLDSVKVDKFEINERNEFEIVLSNVVLKKLDLELEIFNSMYAKLLSKFIKLVFKEKSNGGLQGAYPGPTIDRFQAKIAFAPSRNMNNNIPFIKLRSTDIRINFKNLKIQQLYKKQNRYDQFQTAGFRQSLVQTGVGIFNKTLQNLIKSVMDSVLENLLNYIIKKCYVDSYSLKEIDNAAADTSPFDALEDVVYEPTEMDEPQSFNTEDELFFDAQLHDTPLIGGLNNKRLLLKFKGMESTLQRFENQLGINPQTDLDKSIADHPIAKVIVRKRFFSSLKKVKKTIIQDLLSPEEEHHLRVLLRV